MGYIPAIKEIKQEEESDLAFLSRICEKYGFCLKIYKLALVIFQKSGYEGREPLKIYKQGSRNGTWMTWNRTLSGTYTGAKISYTNPNKPKRRKKGEEPLPDIEVLVGTEGRILYLNETVDTEAEAIETAKARVNKENEKIETLSFTTMFDPNLVASSVIEVTNLPHVEGRYFVSQVRVSMSQSGLKKCGYLLTKLLRGYEMEKIIYGYVNTVNKQNGTITVIQPDRNRNITGSIPFFSHCGEDIRCRM